MMAALRKTDQLETEMKFLFPKLFGGRQERNATIINFLSILGKPEYKGELVIIFKDDYFRNYVSEFAKSVNRLRNSDDIQLCYDLIIAINGLSNN